MTPHTLLIAILLLLPQCGKKKRFFYTYTQEDTIQKFNKLTLPAVKALTINKSERGNLLNWLDMKNHRLIGFNVYRFSEDKFIRKNPINSEPVASTHFYDKPRNTKSKYCYIVRAVFEVEGESIESLSSKVVCG